MSLALTKPCKDCGQVKPLLEFYEHPTMRDGHLNSCIDCHLQYNRDNREAKIEVYRERDARINARPHRVAERKRYAKTARGKAVSRRACKAYRVTHAEQIREYTKLWKRQWRARLKAEKLQAGAQ